MALTSTQQQEIIYYLGWPGKTLIPDSTSYNSTVASRLANLNAPIEKQAIWLLDQLGAIDELLSGPALARLSAKQVGDIQLNENEIANIRKERRILIRNLSSLLEIANAGGSSSTIGIIV